MINKGNMKIIGVILCGAQDEATAEYITHTFRRAEELGYKLLIFNSFTDFSEGTLGDPARAIFKIINYDILDGIILLSETIKNSSVIEEIVSNANMRNIPVVTIITPVAGCYNITFDFKDNFRKIIDHVIEEHKCKKIYFVSGVKGNAFAEERLKCYRDSMTAHGLEVDERGIGYGNFWDLPTYEVVDRWIKDDMLPKPDAIVCANDSMAIATCIKLSEYGYHVPDDIIVTGHDGIEAERYHSPRLTTAITNIEGASKKAVDTIHEILNGDTPDKDILVPSTLVISESCGCTRATNYSLNQKISELYGKIANQSGFENHLNIMAMRLSEDNDFDIFRLHLAEYMDSAWAHSAWICLAPGCMSPKPLTADELADDSTYEPPETRFYDGDKMLNVVTWEKGQSYVPCSVEFDRTDILPNLIEKLENHNMIFFCPIFFRNVPQGYIGLCCQPEYGPFKFTQTFMSYLNMILEVMKQKFFISAAVSQLKSMYILDFMTSLYNRRGFYSKIKPKLENCISLKYDLMVVSVDMDGLKGINDTYGHSEGDYAIKSLSNLLSQSSDENSIIARFGGDEFVVAGVFPDGEATAKQFEETLQRKIDAFNEISDKPYRISASIGISVTKPDATTNLDELIEIADSIMYREKESRKKLRGTKT